MRLTGDEKKREFILNGNIWRVVLFLSAPLILLNAFNYLYGIIDTFVVSKFYHDAVSSVVMIDQIKNLFTAIGSGLATGSSILVSRLIGKNDYGRAKRVANTLLTVAAAVSVSAVAILLPLARPIMKLAQMTDSLIEMGLGYFCVQIVNMGITMFNSVFLGLEKSRGATLNIMALNLVVMAVKIALTLIFAYGFDAGTTWVAVATLIANLITTGYAVVMMLRKNYLFCYSLKNTEFKKDVLKPLFKLSFPVFLGKFVFSLGKVIVNALSIGYGEEAPGALGVSNQISGSVTNVTGSTEDSTSTIVSQNIGAEKFDRIVKAFWATLAVDLIISVVGVTLLTVFNDRIVNFFAEDNEAYAELIAKIFFYEKIGIVALGVNAAVMGLVYGLGYTKLSMIVNLSRLFVFRIPSMLVMINCFPSLGAESLGIAMCVSNCGIGLMSVVIAAVCLVRVKRNKAADAVKI